MNTSNWKHVACTIGFLLFPMLALIGQDQPVKVPRGRPLKHDVRPGPGVTSVRWLSRYNPALAKTAGNTRVYVLEGKEHGGTAVVVGGTHGNEIAGIMAATVLVEYARVQKGRLIVIPNANNSAVSHIDPQRPGPNYITLATRSGQRRFKYGARLTSARHQGQPDPEKFRHPRSEDTLEGYEARNLDRAYPGKADGNLTERIAFAILELIRREGASIAFDLHESGPESRLAWMVVANPKNVDTAALAIVNLDSSGIPMKLEPSSETFRGLSHREWGDAADVQAFLFETPNPAMVANPRGIDTVNDSRYPLARRVGVHLSTLNAVLEAYNEQTKAESFIKLQDVPGWKEISKSGLRPFLK